MKKCKKSGFFRENREEFARISINKEALYVA
jgi:hypothetical protein